MNTLINQLIQFGLEKGMIHPEDVDYSVNLLLDLFGLNSFEKEETEPSDLYTILDGMLEYAISHDLCQPDTTDKDLFDTRIMNCIMPRPSEVVQTFEKLYEQDPKKATDYFYQLSINSNYIRKSRTDKNIVFSRPTEYGDIQISINLSKPEKDPKEIARAKNTPASSYPKCLLCKENVGYAGTASHPARQTHRIIPLSLASGRYYFQYSPYVYYNEHCIVLNEKHIPMKIDRDTFANLFAFVSQFPHYMAGSNTDIPIVGGSILSHDHYQGGNHHFPMEDAKVLKTWSKDGLEVQMLSWPLSTIRVIGEDPEKMTDFACHVLDAWKAYENPELDIIPYTNETRHNAITPIVRKKNGKLEIDLVLRNNRTSEQYPDGIFHPHPENHHIKKENIGLIEVMGLAVLPARLKDELALIQEVLEKKTTVEEHPSLAKHAKWIADLQTKLPQSDLDGFLKDALAEKFVQVLCDAGVFKQDEAGLAAFEAFIESL